MRLSFSKEPELLVAIPSLCYVVWRARFCDIAVWGDDFMVLFYLRRNVGANFNIVRVQEWFKRDIPDQYRVKPALLVAGESRRSYL